MDLMMMVFRDDDDGDDDDDDGGDFSGAEQTDNVTLSKSTDTNMNTVKERERERAKPCRSSGSSNVRRRGSIGRRRETPTCAARLLPCT